MGAFADKRITAAEEMVGATHATKADTLNRLALMSLANTGYLAAFPGLMVRPKFRWKDADEIYIGPGAYHLDGTDEIIVQWNSELTFQFLGLGASERRYVYIDDSAVQAAATNVLTASEFTQSTTAPTYTVAKCGWYNGSDRCIFGGITSGASALLEFFHDGGDYVQWADMISEASGLAPSNTWTDIDCATSMPAFSTRGYFTYGITKVSNDADAYWRTNGQAGTTGHILGTVSASIGFEKAFVMIVTDASQIFEVKWSSATADNAIGFNTVGWYFPVGM